MSKKCCSTDGFELTKDKNSNNKTSCSCCADADVHNEHDHEHTHGESEKTTLQLFIPAILSFVILMAGISLDNWIPQTWFTGWIRLALYLAAYLPVGFPVMKEAVESIRDGDFFSEFLLMSIATIGAFAIGEYPEGVAVMLFYSIGEAFQDIAVTRAKTNIKSLLDQRPDEVTILEDGQTKVIKAETAKIGQRIQLKPGEKLALDGELTSEMASFNTAALTGESKPDSKKKAMKCLPE